MTQKKERAPRNRTIVLTDAERQFYRQRLLHLQEPTPLSVLTNRTIHQDVLHIVDYLPKNSVDLLILDPPYNLTKIFNSSAFKKQDLDTYTTWLHACITKLKPLLKSTASLYICSDWQSSPAVFVAVKDQFHIRNRITWEREKGRGARRNWKNASEDIWFCTCSESYTFNVEAVKLKRKVRAPYTVDGVPKDWAMTDQGNYRLTHPSNLWTDLTVPFWSMAENTDHPTQKPEKLIAKLILASSNPGEVVLDPFLGSGTTSVVAKKLHRRYVGVEQDELYACLTEKRLDLAEANPTIQGYCDGLFWERNTYSDQKRSQEIPREGL